MNKSGQFSDEDDITRVKFIDQNFHHCSKKNMKRNSIWIPAKGIIYLMLGEICMNLQLVNIKWYLNYTSSLHLLTTHQLTYHPQVVLRQFPGCRSLGRVRVWDQELLSELVDQTFIIYNPRHQ